MTDDFHTLNLTSAGRTCPGGQRKISWNGAGSRGVGGPAGATGATGATGTTGTAGPKGDVGASGTAGAPGPAGSKGDVGAAGSTGASGPAGPKGDVGGVGVTGLPGTPGSKGDPGASAVSNFAEFYMLLPPETPVLSPGDDVEFRLVGPSSALGAFVTRSPSTLVLSAVGVYRVAFRVPVTGAGQLELTLNGTALDYTVTGRATGATDIAGEALVQTSGTNETLTLRYPASEPSLPTLRITRSAGGSEPGSATLIIEQLS